METINHSNKLNLLAMNFVKNLISEHVGAAAALPCSICQRMSLANVTLRIDSPWPVHDTAPLELSAYPPQPSLQKKKGVKTLTVQWPC